MIRLLLAVLFPLTIAAQQSPFVLKGQIGHLGPDCHLYLCYLADGKEVHDTAQLQDGKFEFKGSVGEVADALMILSTPESQDNVSLDAIFFFIEKGTMELSGKDSLMTATFTAGSVNQEYQALLAQLKPFRERQKGIYLEYTSAPLEARHIPAFQAAIAEEYAAMRKEEQQVYLTYAATHPNSVISVTALQWYANGKPDQQAGDLYRRLSPAVRNSGRGKAFEKLLK